MERIEQTWERLLNFVQLYPQSNFMKEIKIIEGKVIDLRDTKID